MICLSQSENRICTFEADFRTFEANRTLPGKAVRAAVTSGRHGPRDWTPWLFRVRLASNVRKSASNVLHRIGLKCTDWPQMYKCTKVRNLLISTFEADSDSGPRIALPRPASLTENPSGEGVKSFMKSSETGWERCDSGPRIGLKTYRESASNVQRQNRPQMYRSTNFYLIIRLSI